MSPTIHFVRHARAAHNASTGTDLLVTGTESLVDPGLTQIGKGQCAKLRASFLHHDKVTHVLASPMRRAIQTAILAFEKSEIEPVKAIDLLQETSDAPNDVGSDVKSLHDMFGSAVDLSRVREGWNDKSTGDFEPEWNKLLERSRDARKLIRELAGGGDDHIVVVSHGGMLHFLTDDWQGLSLQLRSTWANCDYRSYEFVDLSGREENAVLRETEASWRQRKGDDEKRPTTEEQKTLRDKVKKWLIPVLKVNKV